MLAATIAPSLAGTALCGAPRVALLPQRRPIKTQDQAVTTAFEAALKVYGFQQTESEKPLVARKSGLFWKVVGSLPRGYDGGVVKITLSAKDGTVVEICHDK